MQHRGPLLWSIRSASDDRSLQPLHLQKLNSLPGWVVLDSEAQTRAADGLSTCKRWDLRRAKTKRGGCRSKRPTQARRSLLRSPRDARPYIKMWFWSSHRSTAWRGWMRGIGFTVQTADPQSASCAVFLHFSCTKHTAAGVCCMIGKMGWGFRMLLSNKTNCGWKMV